MPKKKDCEIRRFSTPFSQPFFDFRYRLQKQIISASGIFPFVLYCHHILRLDGKPGKFHMEEVLRIYYLLPTLLSPDAADDSLLSPVA